jgi:hypothetical protein
VDGVVGGAYSTVHRFVAAGRQGELPDLLPTLAYSAVVAFIGPEAAAARVAEAEAAGVGWRRPLLPCTDS